MLLWEGHNRQGHEIWYSQYLKRIHLLVVAQHSKAALAPPNDGQRFSYYTPERMVIGNGAVYADVLLK